MPTAFISHGGGPCFFMKWTMGPENTWDATRESLSQLLAHLPASPQAILVVSAHWEESSVHVTAHPNPPLLFDYYGFPEHTYQLQWPAPGSPALAQRIQDLLREAGIACVSDEQRGFDHGVFIPLKVAVPNADIPTVAVSLKRSLSPAEHWALGNALAPLRDEGVFIVGSGFSYHSMGGFNCDGGRKHAEAFTTWLDQAVLAPASERQQMLLQWEEAPSARACHPREEHLLPLMVAVGAAAGDTKTSILFAGNVLGVPSRSYLFG